MTTIHTTNNMSNRQQLQRKSNSIIPNLHDFFNKQPINKQIKRNVGIDENITYTKEQLNKFKLSQLKELITNMRINKHNKIFNMKQQKETKEDHVNHILLFYTRMNHIVHIQSWWRKMLVKLLMHYSNFHKYKQTINEYDYLSFEDISKVPCSNLFCYPVTTNNYHSFEYLSFSSLIQDKYKQSKNPYTNVEISLNSLINYRNAIKISFSIFGDKRNYDELDALKKMFIPVQEIVGEYKLICLVRNQIVERINRLSWGNKIVVWFIPEDLFDCLTKDQMINAIRSISKFCKSRKFYELPHSDSICDTHSIFPLVDKCEHELKKSSELKIKKYFYDIIKILLGMNKLSVDELIFKKNPATHIKNFMTYLYNNETILQENAKYLGAYIVLAIVNDVTFHRIEEIKHITLNLIVE